MHVGCIIVSISGAEGFAGTGRMIMSADGIEVHPDAFVTVKLHVPGASPLMVVLVPVPVVIVPPGEQVSVHVPVAGNPDKITLPV
jgi:hypothetical protein